MGPLPPEPPNPAAPGAPGHAEIAPPLDLELLAGDVDRLPPERLLVESGPYVVAAATADELPHLLHEIGRMREVTFRQVGEGTGRPLDLDAFDQRYHHLFCWHRTERLLLGAYRIGRIDELLAAQGRAGVYTATLFDYGEGTLERLSPALELGRSFVRLDFQKMSNVLLLLWKGIGQYVLREPRYRRLIGPVSIDRRYRSSSLQLIVGYLGARHLWPEGADGVKPRFPYEPADEDAMFWMNEGARLAGLDALQRAVAAAEDDARGVPVLIKQYLRLGSEVIGFNVDPDFSDVVDALMLLDLDRVGEERLAYFMGKEAAEGFRAYAGA